jgi:hypothetical protein
MMSNQVFDLRRFTLLFGKQLTDNPRLYLLSPVVVAGTFLFFWSFVLSLSYVSQVNHLVVFWSAYALLGSLYANSIFNSLRPKPAGLSYLMLPASTFEKFCVAWVYVYVIFTVVLLVVFYGVEIVMVSVVNSRPDIEKGVDFGIISPSQLFGGLKNDLFFLPILIQVMAFVGSVYFERATFAKTLTTIAVFVIVSLYLNGWMTDWVFGSGLVKNSSIWSYSVMWAADTNLTMGVKLTDAQHTFLRVYLTLMPFVLWAVVYFRLREKEL